jgi:hypothetical protein
VTSEHWKTREDALRALDDQLASEAQAIDLALESLDTITAHLQSPVHDTAFTRVVALTIAKGRNRGVACYSLALDGLGQESGALFRLLIEAIELVAYVSADPARAIAVLDNKPRVGDIAEAVASELKPLRAYFNEHSSHLSFSYYSMRHLVDFPEGVVRLRQRYGEHVLRTNLHSLIAALQRFAHEANTALAKVDSAAADSVAAKVGEVLAILNALRRTNPKPDSEPRLPHGA